MAALKTGTNCVGNGKVSIAVQPKPGPIFHVGGNHDLANVTMREVWAKRYGSRYYHFVYNDVLFLILDSEDFSEERMQEVYLARTEAILVLEGDQPEEAYEMPYFKMKERSTGEIGTEQSEYFENILADFPEVRWTFLFCTSGFGKEKGRATYLA